MDQYDNLIMSLTTTKGGGFDSNTLGCLSHCSANNIMSCQALIPFPILHSITDNDSNTIRNSGCLSYIFFISSAQALYDHV
ncbi:hypothetical protein Hanom_Chr01g00028841 [Helianthus anomalus]